MKLFRWIQGRQSETEYRKFCFLNIKVWKFGFDGYLLKYEPNTELKPHVDKVVGKHYRLNLTIYGKSIFKCEKEIVSLPFLHIFRPDLYTHSLTTQTKTLKLSLGFAILK